MNLQDKRKPAESPTAQAIKKAHILRTQSRRHRSDILGSYTGTDAEGEAPEQDVDDL